MTFYDIFTYLCTFTIIHSTGSFLPVSSNRSSKDSDLPSADQDQPCFCMLFCSIDHSVYDLSTGSRAIFLYSFAVPVFFIYFKKNKP